MSDSIFSSLIAWSVGGLILYGMIGFDMCYGLNPIAENWIQRLILHIVFGPLVFAGYLIAKFWSVLGRLSDK